jgi:drug/metabolite transporter (DMT)-like permease
MPLKIAPIEGLLLLVALLWGSNFSVIKAALDEFPPYPFNALRLALACAIFLTLLGTSSASVPPRRDWPALAGLGVIGHFLYQVCFMEGVSRTSAANSSIILGATPIVVALVIWGADRRPPSLAHWLGIGLSLFGVYLVVGRGARVGAASMTGDLLMMGAATCWGAYTVAARSVLRRHSPLAVTSWTMAVGTALFIPFGVPGLLALEWRVISLGAWVGLVYSAIFALCVAYLIWYTAVQRIGSARTSVYSNMVPVTAMIVAFLWLGEPISGAQIAGAVSILGGVTLTRMKRSGIEPEIDAGA